MWAQWLAVEGRRFKFIYFASVLSRQSKTLRASTIYTYVFMFCIYADASGFYAFRFICGERVLKSIWPKFIRIVWHMSEIAPSNLVLMNIHCIHMYIHTRTYTYIFAFTCIFAYWTWDILCEKWENLYADINGFSNTRFYGGQCCILYPFLSLYTYTNFNKSLQIMKMNTGSGDNVKDRDRNK